MADLRRLAELGMSPPLAKELASQIEAGGSGGAVSSVNGQTGTVVIESADLDAVAAPDTPPAYSESLADIANALVSAGLMESGGPPPFTPLDLTEVVAWWTAKTFTTTWEDERAAQPYTMTGAIYSADAWPGSLDCVTFDGDDYGTLEGPPGWPVGAEDGFMLIVVSQDRDVAVVSHDTMFGYGEASAVNRTIGRRVTSGVNRVKADTGDGLGNVERQYTSVDFTGPHVVLVEYYGGSVHLSVDGGAPQTAAVVPATTATRSRIGAGPHNPPPGSPSVMKVRDAIVGAGQLATGDRTNLINWALGRAGL